MQLNKIIDGKFHADKLLQRLGSIVSTLSIVPKLLIIIVGNDYASKIYVKNKIACAKKVGIKTEILSLSVTIQQLELEDAIRNANLDSKIHGIVVQLPLPSHINKNRIISIIDDNKDVDGFTPLHVGNLYLGLDCKFIPCTALSCLHLLQSVVSDLRGKHAIIVSDSMIVGKPIASLLLKYGCTITICHRNTNNLAYVCKQGDIIITGVGQAQYLDNNFCKEGAIIIDIGINRICVDGKTSLVGDVDFENVFPYVSYITPVPGGVGPMTVAYLLYNTVKAAQEIQI